MGLQISPTPLLVYASDTDKKYITAYGDTVYYGGSPSVSSTSNDGSLTEGVQTALERTRYFVTAPSIAPTSRAGSARLEVYDRDELEERLDALEAGGGGGPGGGSGTVVTPEDFGATGDGTTDDRDSIQDAIDSLAGKGTLSFDGTKTYKLSSGGALDMPVGGDGLILQGNGATLKLTSGCATAFRQPIAGTYRTVQNLTIDGFNIDGDSVAGQFTAAVFGSFDSDYTNYVSWDRITLRNIYSFNVPTGTAPVPSTSPNRAHIGIFSSETTVGVNPTQLTMTNILIENVHMEGGTHGINVTAGNGAGGSGDKNIYYDNVTLRDCYHDTLTDFTGFALVYSSNYQIGSGAWGGTLTVDNCKGHRSGDVGVEINNFADAHLTDNTIVDAAQANVLVRNYNSTYMDAVAQDKQTCHITNLKMIRDALVMPEAASGVNVCEGIAMGNGNAPVGNVYVNNSSLYVRRQDTLGSKGRAIVGICRRLVVDGFEAIYEDVNFAPAGAGGAIVGINFAGTTGGAATPTNPIAALDNVRIKLRGDQTNGTNFSLQAIAVSGPGVQYSLRDVEVDWILNSGAGITTGLTLGISGQDHGGLVDGVHVRNLSGNSSNVGLRIATSSTIPVGLTISNYVPTGVPTHTNDRIIPTILSSKVRLGPLADTYNVLDSAYGARADWVTTADAAITTGTPNLTSATAAFVSGDVGKTVIVYGAGAAAAPLQTTVSAYVSATAVTLAANAGTTVSGANMGFGTDNRAAFSTALTSAINGGVVNVPSGTYFIDVTTALALTLRDGQVVRGDGNKTILVFGSESPTGVMTAFQASTASMRARVENITFQGPQVIGVGGSAYAINNGATSGVIKLRDVRFRYWTHSMYTSGAGSIIDAADSEIEGYGGTYPSRAFIHDGTSGELRLSNTYCWNTGQTGQAIHTVAATTGVNVSIMRCRFGAMTGSGTHVFHFDVLGVAPTANTLSHIGFNHFSGSASTCVKTPYQGICHVQGNTFAVATNAILGTGQSRIEGNDFASTASAAGTVQIINFAAVATPLVVKPRVRIKNNTFTGRANYAVFATTDLDLTIEENDFQVGDGTSAATSIVRMDTGLASTSRCVFENNTVAGQSSAYGYQTSAAHNIVTGNKFTGTYGTACVGSTAATPTRLVVNDNDFSPVSGSAVNLATTPTTYTVSGNFGSTTLNDNPGTLAGINTQTGASYTFLVADGGKIVEGNSGSAQTFTLPSTLPVGWATTVNQRGAGVITIAGAGTLESRGGLLSAAGQYAALTIWCRASNVYVIAGDLA